MIGYKFLRRDGTSVFSGFRWPLPDGGPGAWVEAPADPCRSGIHACRIADLPFWVNDVLYEIELDGDIVEEPTKVVASQARLLRRVEVWEASRDAYTRMCADRAHDLAQTDPESLGDWEAVVERSIPEGPALLGFIAARIAERASGLVAAYDAERARQAAWLRKHLDLVD